MPVENEEPLDYAAAAKSLMLKPAEDKPAAVDYGAAAKEIAQGNAATSLKLAEGVNPDTAAKALDLSKRSGLPLPAVEGSEDQVAAQLRSTTVAEALDTAPVTRLWFADPINAKIAHDDAESLTAIEHVWNGARALGSGIVDMPGMTLRGFGAMRNVVDRRVSEATIAGLQAIGADSVVDLLTGLAKPGSLDSPNVLSQVGRVIGDFAESVAPDKKDQNFATDTMQGVGQVVAQITAAILSGGVASAVSVGTMLGQGASQQADMVDQAGAAGTAGGDAAILVGAGITALTERYGLDMLLNKIPAATKNRVMQILAGAASEGSQEIIEGVLQNLTAVALYDPDHPLFDGVLYQGGVGAAVGAIVSAAIPGRQVRKAVAGREKMDDANKKAGESALNERSPEKFGEVHGAMMRDQGIDKVAIPAAKLQEFLQSNDEIDQGEWLRNLGVADQMDEALAMGGDVEITPEAYSQHILGTDNYAKLSDHIRMEQDGLTPAEADEWQKTGLKDELARMTEDMANLDPETAAGIDRIQAEVEAQLKAAGEASDSATYAAVLTAQRYAARAERAGTTALALWEADNLQIKRDDGKRAPVTDLDLTIDKARSADAAEFLKLSKTPVLDMLAARGGVDPDSTLAAELRHVGVETGTKRGLFKKGGMGAKVDTRQATLDAGDEVAGPRGIDNIVHSETDLFDDTQANDTGYIPPESIIAAVRDELANHPKRSSDEQTAIDQYNADINWLTDTLNAHNDQTGGTLSLASSTPEEIKAAVAAMEGQGFEQGGPESPEFKAWFGDSKVVDENGKPLVVYHGTADDISQFDLYHPNRKDTGWLGTGVYLTSSRSIASDYSTLKSGDGAANVLPLYAKIENPYRATIEDKQRLQLISHRDGLAAGRDAADAWTKELQAAGYDGVILEYTKERVGAANASSEFVVFSPAGVKSVHNRGTFDGKSPNILEQSDSEPNLVVMHNLKPEAVLHAAKIGGLPIPSIAIANKDIGFDNFGGVTLVGPPAMVDPKQNAAAKTFDADVYSPRYPSVDYDVDHKAWSKLRDQYAALAKAIDDYDELDGGLHDRVESMGLRAIEENYTMRAAFLTERGAMPAVADKDNGKVDRWETRKAIDLAIEPVQSEFSDWAAAKGDGLITKERIFDGFTNSGNRKYLAHNLDNVVKILKRGLRGGESFNYGIGTIRSSYAKQFKSLSAIQGARGNITSKDAMDAAKKEMSDDFETLATDLRGNYKFAGTGFQYYDDLSKVLGEIAKRGRAPINEAFDNLSQEQIDSIYAFISKLREAPTEYFESKIQRVVGLNEFAGAIVPKGVNPKVVETLEAAGLHVVEYDRAVEGDRTRALGEFQSQFFQPARGSIQFGQDSIIVRLGMNADRSTFLHESGHLYLEQLRADAKAYGGTSPALVDDLNTVNSWFADNAASIKAEAIVAAKKAKDAAGVAALEMMTDAAVMRAIKLGTPGTYIATAMHEQWARGTEDYFRTGQAPSVALQEAFNRFRAWLVSIYRAMKNRGTSLVQFSPEVRAVMDRMLATDEEIALVQEQYNLKALFSSAEEIGMTPKQFESYQRTVARATEEAKTVQLKKHMGQIERAKREWWQEEKAKMRAVVAAEVEARQVYVTMYALARGVLPNGEALAVKPGRLDRKATIEVLENEASLARLPKVNSRGIYTTAKDEDGAHPDVIGQLFGYEDGRAMLLDLMNAEPMATAIDAETDAAMQAEYGDMQVDGTAIDEALESTHNDKRGELLAAELNALRESGPKMKAAFVRAWAKERIGTRKVDDIQPAKFLAAEKRYGREAGKLLRAGDRLGAQRAKFQQLLNFYMAKEAYAVRAEVDKARKYMDGFNLASRKFPAIEADYVDNIRTILDAYQLGARLSDRTKTKLEMAAVAAWIEKKKTDDGALLEVPQRILDATEKTHFRDLTLDEFRTLTDSIKNIEAQGRLAKTIIIDGQERDANEAADEIVARLDGMDQLKRVARKATEQNPGLVDRAVSKLATFDAALRKVEFILENIDGEKNGPAHRYLFQTFADAEAARNDLTKSVTGTIMRAMDGLPKEVRKGLAAKVRVPLLNKTFRRSDLLMMALNVGNDSNYNKMLDGSAKDINEGSQAWTEEGVDEALANLSAEEWTFVQTVWDAFENMYPQVEAIYRRENGVAPERVEARTIETRHGQTLRGGYFPMMYDPSRSTQAKDIENKSALEAMQSTVVKASVNSSMTKARTGFSAPVLLDITKLPNHIERTAHFITHYEAVRSTRKLLAKRDLAKAIVNRVGPEYYDTLRNWVNELAANGQPANPTDVAGKIVEAMRTNATVAIMGFSYTTMAAQALGIANGVDALSRNHDGTYSPRKGALWMGKGMVEYLRNPALAKRTVFAASGEMRHRLQNTDRDIKHALAKLDGKRGAWKSMQRFSLLGIAGAQLYMVDFPTWIGAYNRAIATGATEPDAVRQADGVLRTSQTAGGIKDLAAIQRAPGVTKALTMFYSYFSLLYNLGAQGIGNTKGARDVPQLAARAFILLLLPTALEAIMRNEWPDDDEDYAAWLALKAAVYGLSSVPFLRDIVGMAEGFGYSVTPLDSFGKSLGKAIHDGAKALENGELDAKTLKALVATVGFGAGAPVTAVNRIIGAADAMMDGGDVGPYDFLVGYKEKK